MKEKELLDRQVRQLEDFGNDDFRLICLEGAASAYATSELHFLLRQAKLADKHLQHYRGKLQFLTFLPPVGLAAAIACCLLDWLMLTYFLLAFSAFSGLVLLLTYWQLHRGEQRMQDIEHAAQLIQEELSRRRDTEMF